jgi:hypothetical protein
LTRVTFQCGALLRTGRRCALGRKSGAVLLKGAKVYDFLLALAMCLVVALVGWVAVQLERRLL